MFSLDRRIRPGSPLPPDQRRALQDDERRWLTERTKACAIYKWWVECLTELYQKRIAQLKGSVSIRSPSPAARATWR